MQLKGIEFVGYSCFQRQFVPIRDGLNLLVGKNNAGKTAVLRGLSALVDFRNSSNDLRTGLLAYAREQNPEPNFVIEVYVEPEEDYPIHFVEADKVWWRKFLDQFKPTIAYRFWVLPRRGQDQLIFQSAQLRVAERAPLEILGSEQGGISSRFYIKPTASYWPPAASDSRIQNSSGRTIYGPDGKVHLTPLPDIEHFKPLAALSSSRYVAPHRVAANFVEMKSAMSMPDTAENLAIFLLTLQGNSRRKFQKIEKFVTEVFPEFSAVNPASDTQNKVSITLTRTDTDQDIPLSHCGTGVEQVLAIAAFAVDAEPGAILLLDEPHSFLHPAAERRLIDFLKEDKQHRFVVSTHSSIFINSVESERITHLNPPGSPYSFGERSARVSKVLFDLGYRNSDLLFFDRLIAVEGKSDPIILPKLLRAAGVFNAEAIAKTGYPLMDGAAENARSLQSAVLHIEKLIAAMGRMNQPRIYLFDGDREPEDRTLLQRTRNAEAIEPVKILFLPRAEIENYLLVPAAICTAIEEEAVLADTSVSVSTEAVGTRLTQILSSTDTKLFPKGKGTDPLVTVKGSVLLENLYASFNNLVFDKVRSGGLIANHISRENQPALTELAGLFKEFFADA